MNKKKRAADVSVNKNWLTDLKARAFALPAAFAPARKPPPPPHGGNKAPQKTSN
jgi:hypothetical protein